MVAYVLAVIPQVLGSTGGPCDAEAICAPPVYDALGHDCLFVSPEGLACVERVKASLITATTVTSLVACFLLGYFANLPLALAPGLGARALAFARVPVASIASQFIVMHRALS